MRMMILSFSSLMILAQPALSCGINGIMKYDINDMCYFDANQIICNEGVVDENSIQFNEIFIEGSEFEDNFRDINSELSIALNPEDSKGNRDIRVIIYKHKDGYKKSPIIEVIDRNTNEVKTFYAHKPGTRCAYLVKLDK